MSFREANQAEYVASSELSNANTERTQFANVDATRVPHPTQSGQSACLTNAGKPLGLWKSMPISKGDKINAGVSAYYTQTSSMPSGINWALFPVQNPTYGNNEGGTRPFGLPFSLGVILLPNPTPSASVPVAYLRMVFYNAQNAIIQQSVRYVGGQNNLWQYYETGNIEVSQNGRVEIYVANESVPNVWFDNLTITHLPTLISQENHYYAFGMNAKEIEKEGKPDNLFQYNSKEKESFQALDWNDYGARNYDSEVGRWWGVDALSEKYSFQTPYNYVSNNPIKMIDIDGNDNVIYMVDVGGDEKRSINLRKVVELSNQYFENLGVSTRMVLHTKHDGDFDHNNLDKNDGMIFIGSAENVINAGNKAIGVEKWGKTADFINDKERDGGHLTNPETSTDGNTYSSRYKNIVLIAADRLSSNTTYGKENLDDIYGGSDSNSATALTSIHGLGHNATTRNKSNTDSHINGSIMADGNQLSSSIKQAGGISNLTKSKSEGNLLYKAAVQKHFGKGGAYDNYHYNRISRQGASNASDRQYFKQMDHNRELRRVK